MVYSKEHWLEFLDWAAASHPSVSFECVRKPQLPVLDLLLWNDGGKLAYEFFRKPTAPDVGAGKGRATGRRRRIFIVGTA